MEYLPEPPPRFKARKSKLLQQLAVPSAEYTDASPKGSVDEGIRELLDELNAEEGFISTSSCAGRLSVFVGGRKTAGEDGLGQHGGQVAGVGGKGAGGTWLYVSHEAIANEGEVFDDFITKLNLSPVEDSEQTNAAHPGNRLIHFKYEPMDRDEKKILHVLTGSVAHAQLMLHCAIQAGFRESGAVNLTPAPYAFTTADEDTATPMVAVRSMGLAFGSLIGVETAAGERYGLVSQGHLRTLIHIAGERFGENAKRISRFRAAFREAVSDPSPKQSPEGGEWEEQETRRERKRAEGLKRKEEVAREKQLQEPASTGSPALVDIDILPGLS